MYLFMSVTKNITIEVSNDFDNDYFLNNTSANDKTRIIMIGTTAYKDIHLQMLQELNNCPERKIELEQLISLEKVKYELLLARSKTDCIKLSGENKILNEQIHYMEPQLNKMKEKLLAKDDTIYDETIRFRAKIKDEYEAQIRQFETIIQQLQQDKYQSVSVQQAREDTLRKEYETKLDKLRDVNNIYNNSSKKGSLGEIHAHNILVNLLPTAIIINTNTDTARGDIHIQYKGVNILYENKNYDSKNIPKREIDKFLRDVTVTSDCECGIMASLKTGIANRDNFSISYTENGKPVLYLHKTLENKTNIKFAVELLVSVIKNSIVFDESKLAKVKTVLHTINELKKNNDRHHKNIEPFLITYRQNKMFILQLESNVKNIIEVDDIKIEQTSAKIVEVKPKEKSKEKATKSTKAAKSTKSTKAAKSKAEKAESKSKTKKKQNGFFAWMAHHREEIKKKILSTSVTKDKNISILVAQEAGNQWALMSKEDKDLWSNGQTLEKID